MIIIIIKVICKIYFFPIILIKHELIQILISLSISISIQHFSREKYFNIKKKKKIKYFRIIFLNSMNLNSF